MNENNQYQIEKDIIEIPLSGAKIERETNDLDLIARVGEKLFNDNREFIKEKVKDNWFAIVEPISGFFFASPDQVKLFEYVKKKYPDRLFYSVGLIRESQMAIAS